MHARMRPTSVQNLTEQGCEHIGDSSLLQPVLDFHSKPSKWQRMGCIATAHTFSSCIYPSSDFVATFYCLSSLICHVRMHAPSAPLLTTMLCSWLKLVCCRTVVLEGLVPKKTIASCIQSTLLFIG